MFRTTLLLLALLSLGYSSGFKEGVIAKALSVEGIVRYRVVNSAYWDEVNPGVEFHDNDEVQTDEASSCVLIFKEGHTVHVDPNSKLVLKGTNRGKHKGLWQHLTISVGTVFVKLVKGTNEKEMLLIETPYVSVSKKNVMFSVSAPNGKVSAYEGNVEVMNGKKKVIVAEGFESDVNESGLMQEVQPLSDEALEAFDKFATGTTGLRKDTLERVLKRLHSQAPAQASVKVSRKVGLDQALKRLKELPSLRPLPPLKSKPRNSLHVYSENGRFYTIKEHDQVPFAEVRVISENGRFYTIKEGEDLAPQGFFSKLLDWLWARFGY